MSLVAHFPPRPINANNERTIMKVEVPDGAVGNTRCCDTVSHKQAYIDKQDQSTQADIPDSPAQKRNARMQQETTIANLKEVVNWDDLRKEVYEKHGKRERNHDTMDSVDWEAVLYAKQSEIAHAIRKRGQNHRLAMKIQEFLKRLVKEHESIDLEWLRDVHPAKAKEFLFSIHGLGPKSVDCISLLALHHHIFPVDTIQWIVVRLGWASLQSLPEDMQLYDLKGYHDMEDIQKHLWPRLCTLDQNRLYELYYQMITFGKVFRGKGKPNSNAYPMRTE